MPIEDQHRNLTVASMSLLKEIDRARETSLRKSEQKVAACILENPAQVIHHRIVDLAAQAQVSEPTVVRFCRAIGYEGFQEFKLALAQNLAANTHFEQFSLNNSDSVTEFKNKIIDSTVGNLLHMKEALDTSRLEAAIELLARAQRIEFYGFGASAPVCQDAQYKFYRMKVAAAAYTDPHMQTISALTLDRDDVVVAVSQTGRTKDLLHSVRLVQETGANVIALCPDQTPLAELATLAIYIDVDVDEDKDLSTLMPSRVAHQLVIDMLAVGLAMKLGPKLLDHLKTIKKSLRSLRQGNRRLLDPSADTP